MSQVTVRSKSGQITAVQLGLAHAILVAAQGVFAQKPELKATQVITDDNEIVVVSTVKAGYTIEFTASKFKQADIARVSTAAPVASETQEAPKEEFDLDA